MQHWSPSPYRPGMGLDPPYLGDRQPQLRRFREFLAEPTVPSNVVVTGLRGVGKTVLLNHYSAEATAAGWLVAEREFSDPDAVPTVFAQLILTDLFDLVRKLSLSRRARDTARAAAERVSSLIGSIRVSYGDVEVGYHHEPVAGAAHRLDADLRAVFQDLGPLCSPTSHPGIILRYDEFQVVRERAGGLTLSALLAAVAAVQQRGVPVMLVLCGLPAVLENLSRSKSYTERMFVVEELGNLRPPEDRKAFVDPAERLGRRYEQQVIEGVLGETAGYPYFLQLYGDALWKGSPGPVITGDDLQRLRPAILAGLDRSFFEARYLRTAPAERTILYAVARSGESASIEGLQQTTNKGNNAIQPVIARLILKGILYRPARGRVAFTTPLFGAFLRRRGL
ncbi:MAG: AAA family ATPase [Chloroflexota bacterium]